MVAVLNVLFRVVPGTASRTHRDGHEQARDNGAHQHSAECFGAEEHAHQNRHHHRQQAGNHHFLDGSRSQHVHRLAVFGFRGAFHDAWYLAELAAHLFHDRTGCTANRFHGHGAKQVRNQPPDEQPDDHHRVAQVEADLVAVGFQLVGVVGKQHQRGQTGGADRVALGDRLGGVPHGVQWVGDFTHTAGQFGHFGNAASVVGDGAIGIQGDHNARHAQHGGGGHRHAVQTSQRVTGHDRHAHKQHGPGGGLHAHTDAGDDVGGMSRGGRLRHMLYRLVLGAGVVLGDPYHGSSQDQPHQSGCPQAQHTATVGH